MMEQHHSINPLIMYNVLIGHPLMISADKCLGWRQRIILTKHSVYAVINCRCTNTQIINNSLPTFCSLQAQCCIPTFHTNMFILRSTVDSQLTEKWTGKRPGEIRGGLEDMLVPVKWIIEWSSQSAPTQLPAGREGMFGSVLFFFWPLKTEKPVDSHYTQSLDWKYVKRIKCHKFNEYHYFNKVKYLSLWCVLCSLVLMTISRQNVGG